MNLDKIQIRNQQQRFWCVWLPHACSPTEPVGDDIDQEEWGDFYFPTFEESVAFVRSVL